MSLSLNLQGMADVFDAARNAGRPMPADLLRTMSACLRQLARDAATLEAVQGGTATSEALEQSAEVVELRPHFRFSEPVTMGQLLGPRGLLAQVIPLPVVRVEKHDLPGGDT